MIFILIPDNDEPDCLNELRSLPGSSYSDLKDKCKDEVEDRLIEHQQKLCAYCQKHIERVKTLEHYVPISNDTSKQLIWSNLIAVCSGNWYLEDKQNV